MLIEWPEIQILGLSNKLEAISTELAWDDPSPNGLLFPGSH